MRCLVTQPTPPEQPPTPTRTPGRNSSVWALFLLVFESPLTIRHAARCRGRDRSPLGMRSLVSTSAVGATTGLRQDKVIGSACSLGRIRAQGARRGRPRLTPFTREVKGVNVVRLFLRGLAGRDWLPAVRAEPFSRVVLRSAARTEVGFRCRRRLRESHTRGLGGAGFFRWDLDRSRRNGWCRRCTERSGGSATDRKRPARNRLVSRASGWGGRPRRLLSTMNVAPPPAASSRTTPPTMYHTSFEPPDVDTSPYFCAKIDRIRLEIGQPRVVG